MMMPDRREAARQLWDHRQAGTTLAALPEALRPRDIAEGHAIQAEWPAVAASDTIGWKIAATSTAGQAHINVSGPLAGRILAAQRIPPGEAVSLRGNHMRVVEPEFAFALAADLAPRAAPYTVDEVMAAVASLHPTFEMPDSRYTDFTAAGEAQLLADNACSGRFLFGLAAPESWRALDLSTHRVRAEVTDAAGARRESWGEGRAVLGDPRVALTWLVNDVCSRGLTLGRGLLVSTGTCMVPVVIAPGDRVRADYGVLGAIDIAFVD